MKYNSAIFIFLLIALQLPVFGQQIINVEEEQQKNDLFWSNPQITFDPLALASLSALRIGLDMPMDKDFEFALQASFVNDYFGNAGNNEFPLNLGYKIKPEIRFFITDNYLHSTKTYLALDFFYKQVNYKLERWAWDNTNQYQQLIEYDKMKYAWGSNFKIGWKRKTKSNFHLNFFVGLGVRFITFKDKNLPHNFDSSFFGGNNIFLYVAEGVYPSGTAGVNIGFPIKK